MLNRNCLKIVQNFFNCDVQSYEDSLKYVKKLIVVAVSNIAYLRALWPEEFFVTRHFENIELKIIESKADKQAQTLTTWIYGVFHAIERKYVRLPNTTNTFTYSLFNTSKNFNFFIFKLRQFTITIHLDPKNPSVRKMKQQN